MIVSVDWLREYVSVGMPIEDLTDRLTMSGLNLEHVAATGNDTAFDGVDGNDLGSNTAPRADRAEYAIEETRCGSAGVAACHPQLPGS